MRRWIAALLLALLPLQFSWSAVATYCMHERAAASSPHPGHHEHRHGSEDSTNPADTEGPGAAQPDTDCGVCHGVGIGPLGFPGAGPGLPPPGSVGVLPGLPLAGITPSPPDRPRWPALA
jgi:mono/diheme cytochrome c family protein